VRRFIGLDVHRDFCEVAISEGGPARSAGRVAARREPLTLFARSLVPTDRVVLEATGNALTIARIIAPHVDAVVLAHPKRLRAISHAKIKSDRLDARVLAELLAASLVPAVWEPDEATRALRRLISRRRGMVKRRTQVKNEAQAVLHRNLIERPKLTDIFGAAGRRWLATIALADDERITLDGALRQLDFFDAEVTAVDREIARRVVADERVRRLMTIPGVDVTTAATLIATIGDVPAFRAPDTSSATSASTPGFGNPATAKRVTAGPRRTARLPPVTCSWKQRGPPRASPARSAPSPSGSAPGAASRSRPSRLRAS
jgi:transposase